MDFNMTQMTFPNLCFIVPSLMGILTSTSLPIIEGLGWCRKDLREPLDE